MEKIQLKSVTLLGVDCVDIERLLLASQICQKEIEFAKVSLLSSLPSNHKDVVPVAPIASTEEYSEFVIAKLDKYVHTSHALVIQYDGFILNSHAWSDEFLDYDYIGAPWLIKEWSLEFGFTENDFGKMVVGNGGFSLRSKKLLELCSELAEKGEIKRYHPEDMSLCVWHREMLESYGIKFAPVEVAKRFSFELKTDVKDKWDDQFGFHGFRWTDITNWSKDNPEYIVDAKQNTITLNPKR